MILDPYFIGVLCLRRNASTAAFDSGLNVNDEIISIDDYRMHNSEELNALISRKNAGETA